jgi:hypothetical protein
MLAVRLKTCLCHELHAIDSMAVDPACTHNPAGGGGFKAGPETALCISADIKRSAEMLPANWLASHKVWRQMLLSEDEIRSRRASWRRSVVAGAIPNEPEPIYSRGVAIRRMAKALGWRESENVEKLTKFTNALNSNHGKSENGKAAL